VSTGPLPRNGPGIPVHLAVVAYQRLYKLHFVSEFLLKYLAVIILWCCGSGVHSIGAACASANLEYKVQQDAAYILSLLIS
jgi:hypothetical protein